MACLDTTILVDLIRRRSKLRRRALRKIEELLQHGELLVTTRLNIAELYVGIERSDNPDREREAVEEALRGLGVLDFDEKAARFFGLITAKLQEMGRPAGDMDVLIAASCLSGGHCLVTRDASHFADVPELVVETY